MQAEMHTQHLGYEVIATDAELPQLVKEYRYGFITVGQFQSPDLRIRLYQRAVEIGFTLPSVVAPTAHVSRHASIGAGTIVMHGAIVNAGAKIGKNCIINSRALVEHDTVVEDHCHISTGAILNGSVRIGAGSFVGSGCAIKDGVEIGENCIVGMGLCVRHNQANNTKFLGHDIS
jgi:sugar O-acyltransferase (sialic acid O-acetyltransferase NeuD family)